MSSGRTESQNTSDTVESNVVSDIVEATSGRAGRRAGALVPALFWVCSLVGMAMWGDQLYAGSKAEWPMFWLYIAFGIGNVALGVTGVWISELYPVNLRATVVSTFYIFRDVANLIAHDLFGSAKHLHHANVGLAKNGWLPSILRTSMSGTRRWPVETQRAEDA